MSTPDTTRRISRKQSRPASLDKGFEHKLFAYATAASAAGVAAISLAQPCHAEIVYTKTHQVIGSYSLDLNNDGIVDFTITNSRQTYRSGHAWSQTLSVQGIGTNQVWDTYGGQSYAQALVRGAIVGPGDNFGSSGRGRMDKCKGTFRGTTDATYGSWIDVRNHYLGFSFAIDGQTHYGWARLSSKVRGKECKSTVVLTGYAYETIPGQAIEAGKQRGDDIGADGDASAAAGTLGRLALGSAQSGRPDSEGSQK